MVLLSLFFFDVCTQCVCVCVLCFLFRSAMRIFIHTAMIISFSAVVLRFFVVGVTSTRSSPSFICIVSADHIFLYLTFMHLLTAAMRCDKFYDLHYQSNGLQIPKFGYSIRYIPTFCFGKYINYQIQATIICSLSIPFFLFSLVQYCDSQNIRVFGAHRIWKKKFIVSLRTHITSTDIHFVREKVQSSIITEPSKIKRNQSF